MNKTAMIAHDISRLLCAFFFGPRDHRYWSLLVINPPSLSKYRYPILTFTQVADLRISMKFYAHPAGTVVAGTMDEFAFPPSAVHDIHWSAVCWIVPFVLCGQ